MNLTVCLKRVIQVDRILSSFELNPYDVFGVRSDASQEEVKQHLDSSFFLIYFFSIRSNVFRRKHVK